MLMVPGDDVHSPAVISRDNVDGGCSSFLHSAGMLIFCSTGHFFPTLNLHSEHCNWILTFLSSFIEKGAFIKRSISL